jgi:lipopolysaccharide transport system permease protein
VSENEEHRRFFRLAVADLLEGIACFRFWGRFGLSDIRQRYRRSVIGPLWLTISNGISVATIGVLWTVIFKADAASFIPHFCLGVICWTFISGSLNEGSLAFTSTTHIIRHVKYPYSAYIFWVLWRNIIIFGHIFLVFVGVALIFSIYPTKTTLLFPVGLLLNIINLAWVMLFLGLVSARFRDVPPIVGTLLNILFFLTPVIWRREQLGAYQYLINLNPLAHMLEVMRAPLLGVAPPAISWVVLVAMAAAGWTVVFFLFARIRHRIPYWL